MLPHSIDVGSGYQFNQERDTWLVVLSMRGDHDKVVYRTQHFQKAVNKCNALVKIHNLDYSVWLESEYEESTL